jgi:glutamate synthase domain-containing protein 3
MKATSKITGAVRENNKFDYFKYFEENKHKVKPKTYREFLISIEKERTKKNSN